MIEKDSVYEINVTSPKAHAFSNFNVQTLNTLLLGYVGSDY